MPTLNACGKLNGAKTAQTPNGRRTERLRSAGSSESRRRAKPSLRFHLGRIGIDDVGRFLDLADGLDAVLAGLEDEQRRQAELSLADQRRGAAHDRDSLLPGPLRPSRKGGFGGGHGIIDVGFGAGRETADDDLVVGRRADLEGVGAGALFAADNQGVGLTEVAAKLLEGGVEGVVHRLDLLGGRGVGDLVGNGHGYSSSECA